MWIAIIAVISLVLAFTAAAPKKEVEDARVQGLGDDAFPKSKYGDAVPWIFGTCEQKSPIIMWYGHFQPIANTEDVRTGLFSSETRIVSYRYLLGFDLGICLGPGILLEKIKIEGGRIVWDAFGGGGPVGGPGVNYFNGSIQGLTFLGGGFAFYPGNFAPVQQKDAYMTAGPVSGPYWNSGAGLLNLPSYAGICHIVFVQFFIGDDNAVPPRFSFIVRNLSTNLDPTYSVMSNGVDLNPMEIVYTVLTQQWGGLGIDPSQINLTNFIDVAQTLHTEGFGMSMIVSQDQEASKVIKECMRVADGVMYQDPTTGQFNVKLIRNDYTVGSLPVLDESNIIGELEGFGRTTWEDVYNQVKVNYQSRGNAYQSQVAVVQDEGNIRSTNKVRSTTVNFPGVKDDNLARVLAARELEFLSSPLLKTTIKCNRIAKDFRPGDLFVLNWAPYGLTNAVMRIVKIDFGQLTNNEITIECVQDKFAADLASFDFPDENEFDPIDLNAPEITDFVVFDPPLFLVQTTDNIDEAFLDQFDFQFKPMVLAKAPTDATLSFHTYVSFERDPDKYKPMNLDQPFIGRGLIEGQWANHTVDAGAFSGHATNAQLILYDVDQETKSKLIDNANLNEARDGSSLMLMGSGLEIIAYVGFTDLGGDRVQFDVLYRGMLDRPIRRSFNFYPPNTEVYFIRRGSGVSETFFYPITTDDMYYKLASRTQIGILDIDTIAPFVDTLNLGNARLPLPAKGLRVNGAFLTTQAYWTVSASSFTLSWYARSRRDPELYAYEEDYNGVYGEDDISYQTTILGYKGGVFGSSNFFTTSTSDSIFIGDFDDTGVGLQGNLIGIHYARKINQFGQTIFSIAESFSIEKT